MGILPQLMATHVLPVTHSLVIVHDVRHVVPDGAHVYGVHEFMVGGRHMPAPSQLRADDSRRPRRCTCRRSRTMC
jgi:hypothetical protein